MITELIIGYMLPGRPVAMMMYVVLLSCLCLSVLRWGPRFKVRAQYASERADQFIWRVDLGIHYYVAR